MTTLTPELLADLRKKAEEAARYVREAPADNAGWGHDRLHPAVVLALLGRIEALEAKWERPSTWRCDGCGHIEHPGDGRRPDAHPSCGGYWVRVDHG